MRQTCPDCLVGDGTRASPTVSSGAWLLAQVHAVQQGAPVFGGGERSDDRPVAAKREAIRSPRAWTPQRSCCGRAGTSSARPDRW